MSKLCCSTCSTLLKLRNRFNRQILSQNQFHRETVFATISQNVLATSKCMNLVHRRNTATINDDDDVDRKGEKFKVIGPLLASIIGCAAVYYLYRRSSSGSLKIRPKHTCVRTDLPTFSTNDVSKHNSTETGIWVTYGIGVYDITTFVPNHRGSYGSDVLMVGAGRSIDPFWYIYEQHNTDQILKLLESFRIGNLLPEDAIRTEDLSDIWLAEPKRHPVLKPASLKPFNAEAPSELLVEYFITPVEFFYVRNHLPVPDVDVAAYELNIEIEGSHKMRTLTLNDIKKLPKHDVTVTIMCGGNRRSEMAVVKPVRGLSFGPSAVGNAVWSGAKLSDILREMGVQSDESSHVQFEGLDVDHFSNHYAASIPLAIAMDPRGDVILAYEMNGEPLTRDHGYPVRIICPGIIGARNVKWLGRIVVSKNESDSHWQQNDYKVFSPSTDWNTVDFTESPAIQNMPVTSAICYPTAKHRIKIDDNGCVTVKGYAWSGGGNKIVRVDLTADGGKSWHVAKLQHGVKDENQSNSIGRHWAWSLWTAKIPVPNGAKRVEIWSKAVDSNYNVQPESFENIWNLRGFLSNAYSRVRVNVVR